MNFRNKITKLFSRSIWILCIPAFISITSFFSDERKIIDVSDAAPGDFSWLKDFYILSQCLSLDHFDKTPGKSYDPAGLAMLNGKYHPVNLFQYGIFCFDKYRQTHDADFKKKCIAQFRYFLDSTNYHIKPDGSIAFPYLINWRDLKPPWYSGLAQTEAIMYLVRYYYLTKDVRALAYIKRSYNFMMVSVKDSGTFNNLPDNDMWVEEYPNSKSKPQVINGFVTSIMGMREYCYMFPKDAEAKKVLEACIATHKKWVHKYDYGSGIFYDLGEKQKVGPWYMKFQVVQMKQMHELYGDIFYHDLEMLWATYAYNKPVPGMHGCLLTDTNYSVPAQLNNNNEYIPSSYIAYSLKPDMISKFRTESISDVKNNFNLFDGNKTSTLAVKSDTSNDNKSILYVQLKKPLVTENILIASLTDSLPGFEIELFHRKDSLSRWKPVKIKNIAHQGKNLTFNFKQIEFYGLKIIFNNMHGKKSLILAEINCYNNTDFKTPHFSHFETPDFSLTQNKTRFQLKETNINDFVIFHKSANNLQDMAKATWNIYEGIRKTNFELECNDKLCRFLVVFKNSTNCKAQLQKM